MPNYIFAYHGGSRPKTPEEGKAVMEAWQTWLADIGESVIEMGSPVGMSKTVTANGVENDGGSNPLSGYTIVTADTMDDAVGLAKGCPITDADGTVEVAELMSMSMDGK